MSDKTFDMTHIKTFVPQDLHGKVLTIVVGEDESLITVGGVDEHGNIYILGHYTKEVRLIQ
jgi:hypothetical protein